MFNKATFQHTISYEHAGKCGPDRHAVDLSVSSEIVSCDIADESVCYK